MKSPSIPSGCACCPMNRRNFVVKTSAATAGVLGLLGAPAWLRAADPAGKTRIRVVYSLHGEMQAGPDWPNKGFDFRPVMDGINGELNKCCPGFEFLPSLAKGEPDAMKILETDTASGDMTTTIEFEQGRKGILFHRGKAVDNDPDDRACRTKLCAEPVGDFEKLFTEWDQWGWHRVTFYGDLKEPIYALADAIGWKVREEA